MSGKEKASPPLPLAWDPHHSCSCHRQQVCTYIRVHVWVLAALASAQTLGLSSFKQLAPKSFLGIKPVEVGSLRMRAGPTSPFPLKAKRRDLRSGRAWTARGPPTHRRPPRDRRSGVVLAPVLPLGSTNGAPAEGSPRARSPLFSRLRGLSPCSKCQEGRFPPSLSRESSWRSRARSFQPERPGAGVGS